MNIAEHVMDPRRFWPGEAIEKRPLAIVELTEGIEPADIALPPYPVIGIGDSIHPLARFLDAVIEPPVKLEAVVRQIVANPLAAAAIVRLLRILPALTPAQGLVAESMAYAMLQGSDEHKHWLAARRSSKELAKPGGVRLERAGGTLIVTLDRPEAGNAIDSGMRDGLHDVFMLAALDDEIVSVTLRAEGKAFSLGADLDEFGTTTDPATAHAIRSTTLPALAALRCAGKFEAYVHGACVGAGLELAAYATRLNATSDAWFQLPELAMGILPGAGGCVSLTRRIGRQRTALMILSGKRLSARQALAWGLIDRIADDVS